MVFSSLAFLFLFLPATLAAYYAIPNRVWRNTLLLLASLVFYAWGEPVYVFLILLSTLTNWWFALLIARSSRRRVHVLVLAIALNLLSLAVFKYANFFVRTCNEVLGLALEAPRIALPIGISFFTFQAISYLTDVFRRQAFPQPNPAYFGTYLTMFSHMVCGPIVRYQTIEGELRGRSESLNDFANGVRRFGLGLAKKVLIANSMGRFADAVLLADPTVGAIPSIAAFAAYTFQIYFDFSGYSDMAIGLGRMLGFHFLENFDYPYMARSVSDFWRRWHISLSTFFRDYVYIPLGGNRVDRPRWVFNILVVWSLTGLWHGANWNFVCWGAYYGLLIIIERLVLNGVLAVLPRLAQHAYTLAMCVIGWVIFRVDHLALVPRWLGAMLGWYGLGHPGFLNAVNVLHLWPWFIVAGLGATPFPKRISAALGVFQCGVWLRDLWILLVFAWSLLELVVGGFNPFIYFRF